MINNLSYPNYYIEQLNQYQGIKYYLKLIHAITPESGMSVSLVLLYQWEEKLSDEEVKKLGHRIIAYISCAIYDAAIFSGLKCQPSKIPNGLRPAWMIEGESAPVSLTLSDIDPTDMTCQLCIGPVMVIADSIINNKRLYLSTLLNGFEAKYSNIII
jgi:hypothetical protein